MLYICAADVPSTRPGKIRGSELPQEYKLHRFAQGIKPLHPTWSTNTPACEWYGVRCDKEGEVTELDFNDGSLQGTVFLEHLPKFVVMVDLSCNEFRGLAEFGLLASNLEILRLQGNLFTGSIENLPGLLLYFSVACNMLTGELNFALLPATLHSLDVSFNKLSGALHFGDIKSKLTNIDLRRNFFGGEVNFKSIPSTVLSLLLEGNSNLSGVVDSSTYDGPLHDCLTLFTGRTKIRLPD